VAGPRREDDHVAGVHACVDAVAVSIPSACACVHWWSSGQGHGRGIWGGHAEQRRSSPRANRQEGHEMKVTGVQPVRVNIIPQFGSNRDH
jgi:hypothetical protein